MREEQKKKMELINDINSQRGTLAVNNMEELCDLMIDEIRKENDTAGDSFRHNQGRIDAWKKMKEVITVGIPNRTL